MSCGRSAMIAIEAIAIRRQKNSMMARMFVSLRNRGWRPNEVISHGRGKRRFDQVRSGPAETPGSQGRWNRAFVMPRPAAGRPRRLAAAATGAELDAKCQPRSVHEAAPFATDLSTATTMKSAADVRARWLAHLHSTAPADR